MNKRNQERSVGDSSKLNEGEDLAEWADKIIDKRKTALNQHKDPCSFSENVPKDRHVRSTNSSSDQFNDYRGTFLKDALEGKPGVTVIKSLQNAYSIDSTANLTVNTR